MIMITLASHRNYLMWMVEDNLYFVFRGNWKRPRWLWSRGNLKMTFLWDLRLWICGERKMIMELITKLRVWKEIDSQLRLCTNQEGRFDDYVCLNFETSIWIASSDRFKSFKWISTIQICTVSKGSKARGIAYSKSSAPNSKAWLVFWDLSYTL